MQFKNLFDLIEITQERIFIFVNDTQSLKAPSSIKVKEEGTLNVTSLRELHLQKAFSSLRYTF